MLSNTLILAAVTFVVALVVCLLLTPQLIRMAQRRQLLDQPSQRRVHQIPVPRIGGVAIFLAFGVALGATILLRQDSLAPFGGPEGVSCFLAGALVIFVMGLWDDLRRLRARYKLLIQIAVAAMVWWGGARVDLVGLPGLGELHLAYLSLPITVFWFLLLINALNLIDGLDGLAGGITVLTSVVLAILCIVIGRYNMIPLFAALAGASLGFLRYNFNPASIFMGDSGSYFLGYCLGYFSIIGSVKGQAAVTILIPLVAIGMPVFEVIFTPIRRFLSGQDIFQPDNDHVHHRLLKKGLTHRKAVLLLYGFSIVLGVVALAMVHAHNMASGFILLGLGIIFVLGIRKLGYLEYIALDKLSGWLRDLTDEVGLLRDRRTFLGRQMVIASSNDLDQLSENVSLACQQLKADYLELKVPEQNNYRFEYTKESASAPDLGNGNNLLIKMPLNVEQRVVGSLTLVFCLNGKPVGPHTLRRAEQLRRVICSTLAAIMAKSKTEPGGPAGA